MAFAEGTSVSPEKSRGEIQRTLARFGADAFAFGEEDGLAVVAFRARGRRVRFSLPLPTLSDDKIRLTATGQLRSTRAREDARTKEVRRLWRALHLVVKAKLEAVESGIVSFEEEFAAFTLLPDGTTVGEWLEPQLVEVYETGQMPSLLPGSARQLTENT